MKIFAIKSNGEGNRLLEKGDYIGAEEKFLKATVHAPQWPDPWYNLGLVHKRMRNWKQSLEYNQRATQLDPKNEAAWWNLGIAATAIADWELARDAWSSYGVALPPGDGPIEMNLGLTPIRLNPDRAAEVVWCDRIDPARAIVRNVPFPSAEHRYGDLVLHDGQPNGYRMYSGKEVPVFDELELLEASPYSTYEIIIEASSQTDKDDLLRIAGEHHVFAEDWSKVRMLCHLCSKGKPHSQHEPQTDNNGPLVRYGLAAIEESDVQALIDEWHKGRVGCLLLEFSCVFPSDR